MKRTKITIDILMYILFIILMGHHITENIIHEILGVALFVLFLIHHILNISIIKLFLKVDIHIKKH